MSHSIDWADWKLNTDSYSNPERGVISRKKFRCGKCHPKMNCQLEIQFSVSIVCYSLYQFLLNIQYLPAYCKKIYQPGKKRNVANHFFHYEPFTTYKIKLIKKTMNLQCRWSNNAGLYCIPFLAVLATILKTYEQSFSLSFKNILIK